MKINRKAITIALITIFLLNLPLLLLLFKTNNITNEQLTNNEISTVHINKFDEFLGQFTPTSDNLSGFSLMYRTYKPKSTLADITITDEANNQIYEDTKNLKASNIYRNNVFISVTTHLIPNHKYNIKLKFRDYSESFRINTTTNIIKTENKKKKIQHTNELLIRPTYKNNTFDSVLIYNRLSQYKPTLLKGNIFILFYVILNVCAIGTAYYMAVEHNSEKQNHK